MTIRMKDWKTQPFEVFILIGEKKEREKTQMLEVQM